MLTSLFAAALTLAPAPASAQIPGLDEWAAAVVGSGPRWEGPRVPHPVPGARPDLPVAARSALRPIAIHAGPEVPAARVEAALAAAEYATDLLDSFGWPAPMPDGGLGDTGDFDLYLVAGERPSDAFADSPVPWTYLDAATAWARVDPTIDRDALPACIASAYVEAALLGQDPAEDVRWRRATATFAAWLVTGRYGCDDSVISQQQQEPWRSWIIGAAGEGAGGALLLTALSARNDAEPDGEFIRELWQLARQRTWEGDELRASPDLWEALDKVLEVGNDPLPRVMRDLAVARWFTGDSKRKRGQPMRVFDDLPPDAVVPLMESIPWDELPEHTPPMEPATEPYGSGYAWIDARAAPDDSVLRVWLRGELGVRWALTVVRIGEDGRELSRIEAPPRDEPRGYVVVELFDDTAEVVLIGTNMSSRVPDADIPDENVRSFKLIADRYL